MTDDYAHLQLDADNPWPGLAAYEENAASYFCGRDDETAALLRCVTGAPLSVLYGRSGLGKTSLLQAALFPALRPQFLPVYIRLDFRPDAPPIGDQLRACLREAVRDAVPTAVLPADSESVWEYLHRAERQRVQHPIPMLVIDQFEEVFTLGKQLPDRVEEFRYEFGDLAENRVPPGVVDRLTDPDAFALRSQSYRILISLREDFLPDLEGWQRLIPLLGRSRLRLLPMGTAAATEAVFWPAAHLMTQGQAERIVRFVAGESARSDTAGTDATAMASIDTLEVEPALLSLICRELNEERKRRHQATFDDKLIDDAVPDVLRTYYATSLRDMPPAVGRFVENHLITRNGFRNSYALRTHSRRS